MSRFLALLVMGLVLELPDLGAAQSSEDLCFQTSDPAKVVVRVRTDFNACPTILGYTGAVYETQLTAGRAQIPGCFINNRFPTGYTNVATPGIVCGSGTSVTWYLNRNPLFNELSARTPVNTPFQGFATTTDPDGDALIYGLADHSSRGGSVTLLNSATGAFRYVPPQFLEADDVISGFARDSKGGVASLLVDMTVGTPSSTNRPPVFPSFTTTLNQAQQAGIVLSAFDPDGDSVTIALDPAAKPAHGTLVTQDAARSIYLYRPDPAYSGADSFGAIATDSKGSQTRTTFPLVIQLNHAPLFPAFTSQVRQDSSVQIALQATDQDADSISIALDPGAQPRHGQVAVVSGGVPLIVRYTPVAGFSGSDSFGAVATDGRGLSTRSTFAITVTFFDAAGDSDGDGMSNGFEVANGFDPNNAADGSLDADADGFSNVAEFRAGSDPRNPSSTPASVELARKLAPIIDLLLDSNP